MLSRGEGTMPNFDELPKELLYAIFSNLHWPGDVNRCRQISKKICELINSNPQWAARKRIESNSNYNTVCSFIPNFHAAVDKVVIIKITPPPIQDGGIYYQIYQVITDPLQIPLLSGIKKLDNSLMLRVDKNGKITVHDRHARDASKPLNRDFNEFLGPPSQETTVSLSK